MVRVRPAEAGPAGGETDRKAYLFGPILSENMSLQTEPKGTKMFTLLEAHQEASSSSWDLRKIKPDKEKEKATSSQ